MSVNSFNQGDYSPEVNYSPPHTSIFSYRIISIYFILIKFFLISYNYYNFLKFASSIRFFYYSIRYLYMNTKNE